MFYGDVRFVKEKRSWAVLCQPHVALRLKRVFPQLGSKSQGSHVFSDNPSFCHDLVWFLSRYPMAMTVEDRHYLLTRSKEHKEQIALVEDMLRGHYEPQPFDLAKPPREYQKIAASMVLTTGGLLLADDLGLGKTVTAITMHSDPRARPALVVCYPHLRMQWQDMLKEFAPDLVTHIIKRATPYDLTQVPANGNGHGPRLGRIPDVLIMSYHGLPGWAETLAPLLHSMTFDECQELRTGEEGKSAKYAAAQYLAQHVPYKLGLSATPIYNYGGEIFNVIDILRPGALGTRSEFIEQWCEYERGKVKVRNPKALGAHLRDQGLMLRRTRKDVGRELPAEPVKITHRVDADTKALDSVTASCAELARVILRQGPQIRKGEKFEAAGQLDAKLRQATGIAKAPFVADYVRLLLESGESILLYGWHHAVYKIWMDRLQEFQPVLFTGDESPTQKEKAKRRFLSQESRLMIMSLRAGAGTDGLQKVCRICVFGELDWSSGVHDQCIGRLGRDDSIMTVNDPVMAYFLICDSGSDPVMADVLGVKKSQSAGIRDPHLTLVEKLAVNPAHIKMLAQQFLDAQNKRHESRRHPF